MRRLGIGDEGEGRHRRAERHDLRRAVPGLLRLDRALHHAPFAHAELVALALVVERFHGALEDVLAQRLVVGVALARPRRLEDLDVQALVPEEALVARDQERQVVDRVHHRNLHLLQRFGHGVTPPRNRVSYGSPRPAFPGKAQGGHHLAHEQVHRAHGALGREVAEGEHQQQVVDPGLAHDSRELLRHGRRATRRRGASPPRAIAGSRSAGRACRALRVRCVRCSLQTW